MLKKRKLHAMKGMSEINLTPLMDLSFILLVTFIITFPLVEQGIFVNLPKGKTDKIEPEKSVSVTVDKDGQAYIEQKKVSLGELKADLGVASQNNPSLIVYVRADEAVQYRNVVEVLKVLHECNISRMSLVTQAD